MKHARSPYMHFILQMLSIHWVKFKPKSYFMPKSYTLCLGSALTAVDVAQYTANKTEIYTEHDKKEINATNAQR
jgi:hypothetical protein